MPTAVLQWYYGLTEWTDEDIQFLADNYGRLPITTIAKKLSRTVLAVKSRANREGFCGTDTFLAANQVAAIFGADSHTVVGWIQKGFLKAKKSKVVRRGGNFVWHIEHAALEDFIRDYTQLYDVRRISKEQQLYWRNLAEKHVPKNQVPNIARAWQPHEDAYLLNHRKHGTQEELGETLNRTKEAVHGRLGWLKKQGRLIPPSRLWENRNRETERIWTEEEDAYLVDNWRGPRQAGEAGWGSHLTAEEIANRLNRTKDSCVARAKRLRKIGNACKAS